jgi:hypothetical protein
MRKVYNYLEIPYFAIDYSNVQQVTFEDDKFHGRYGDHKINSTIKPIISNKDILGDSIHRQLYDKNRWYFDYFKY